MKKFTFLFLLVPLFTQAQQTEKQVVISGGIGYSLLGKLISIIDIGSNKTESYASPVTHFAIDYGLKNRFSLGLGVGYQKAGIRYTDYEFTNINGDEVTEDFEWTISRLNIGARALYHYGPSPEFDMYTGVRLGFQNFTSKANTSNPNFDPFSFKAGAIGAQFIAFGARGYFLKGLGFHFELAIGSPYIIMGGLSYRIGGM